MQKAHAATPLTEHTGQDPLPHGRVVVLCSGGIDSSAAIAFFLNQHFQVQPLFCDYGQPAAMQEYNAATAICHYFGLSLSCIRCTGLSIPDDGYILGRNAFLLSCALMHYPWNSGMVALGIHRGSSYPDCTQGFIETMQAQYDLYTDGCIKIIAPFLQWSKLEIWQFCHSQAVPLKSLYSCERGGIQPCGICLSCKDLEDLYACEK